MTHLETTPQAKKAHSWLAGFILVILSVFYFADVLLRASQKYFWFDELYTVYLCRLPTFRQTWTAVSHGADFNPPLFYLLTRGAERLFGHGLIGPRIPGMIGVWIFCVCLFFFVSRRAGTIVGFIAGIFPLLTLVRYYAYEARPHGIMVGWCGLALICWQRAKEEKTNFLWLAGLWLSLTGALLTHVYGVYLLFPFVLVEVVDLCRTRRFHWRILIVLALALAVAVPVYLPLLRVYRQLIALPAFHPPSLQALMDFLENALGPATGLLLLALAFLVLDRGPQAESSDTAVIVPRHEIVLAAGFACIPIAGVIGARLSRGPFIDRYFLSSIAGYAMFLAFASRGRRRKAWGASALAGVMLLLFLGDAGTAVYLWAKHKPFGLIEPSGKFAFSAGPQKPLTCDPTLLAGQDDRDILVFQGIEYFYLFRYAPQAIVPRLYFAAPVESDIFLREYNLLAKWANLDLRTTTLKPYLATHKRFLVYEDLNGPGYLDWTPFLLRSGYTLRSIRASMQGVVYEYEK